MASARSEQEPRASRMVSAVQNRYGDAYRYVETVNFGGQIIKVAGVVFAIMIFTGATAAFEAPGTGLIAGLVFGSMFMVVGIVVAAQGQILRAALDTAVNSSPFLDDAQKAAIMSLPALVAPRRGGLLAAAVSRSERDDIGQQDATEESEGEMALPFCYHCGTEFTSDTTTCNSCGKRL